MRWELGAHQGPFASRAFLALPAFGAIKPQAGLLDVLDPLVRVSKAGYSSGSLIITVDWDEEGNMVSALPHPFGYGLVLFPAVHSKEPCTSKSSQRLGDFPSFPINFNLCLARCQHGPGTPLL
jgi:hypothetical protein